MKNCKFDGRSSSCANDKTQVKCEITKLYWWYLANIYTVYQTFPSSTTDLFRIPCHNPAGPAALTLLYVRFRVQTGVKHLSDVEESHMTDVSTSGLISSLRLAWVQPLHPEKIKNKRSHQQLEIPFLCFLKLDTSYHDSRPFVYPQGDMCPTQ